MFLKTPEGLETPSFRVLADPEEVRGTASGSQGSWPS
jgi:hypothetical protein